MIRIHVSDDETRWIMPHRILVVKAYVWNGKGPDGEDLPWSPREGRHVLFSTGWNIQNYHTTPPKSGITYDGGTKNCPDHLLVKETPEQIAAMVKAAMAFVQIAPQP